MCRTYVSRPSGLLVKFDPPGLTMAAAIDRGWERRAALMLPRPEEFLPTYPMPSSFADAGRVSWLDGFIYGAPWGPVTGNAWPAP